jgi:hypothetical protein
MQKSFFLAIVILLSANSALALTKSEPFLPTFPKLYFDYSYLYDSNCAPGDTHYKIDEAWQNEVEKRTPEFQALWEKNAPELLGAVINHFHRGWSRKELTATLSLCDTGSMSNPLIVNARAQLVSFMNPKPVRPDYAFVDTVFHELLHNFVVENLPDETPLLKHYENEHRLVKNHLHVLAIEKLVYTKLQKTDELAWLEYLNNRIGGEYLRAWQIVNKADDYLLFVAEFPKN